MKKHFSIRVSGKVQGVFFRASTKQKANDLGLTGFVKNERDGSVYIEAEGNDAELNMFIEWCRTGPPSARVDYCEIEQGEVNEFKDFIINKS